MDFQWSFAVRGNSDTSGRILRVGFVIGSPANNSSSAQVNGLVQ